MGRGHRARTGRRSRRPTAAATASSAITLRLQLGRVLVDEVQTGRRGARRSTAPSTRPTATTPRRSPRSSSSTAQTSRFADLLGIYEKRRDLSTDADEKKPIIYEIAKLYETEIKDVDKAIDTYIAGPRGRADATRSALAALDVLYGQLGRWEPYVDTLRRRIELDVGESELIDLKFRLGQTLEKHLGDAAGALENYREILFLDAQHEGRAPRARGAAHNADLQAEAAAILEEIYEERGDWPKLIGALEILARAEGDVEKRVAAPAQGRAHQRRDDRTTSRAPSTALAVGAQGRPVARRDARRDRAHRRARRAPGSELVALYDEIAESLTRRGARARLLDAARARSTSASATSTTRRRATTTSSRSIRPTRRRSPRWSSSSRAPSGGAISSASSSAASSRPTTPRSARRSTCTMAQIYDEQLGRPEDAVAAYRKVLELDPASHARARARSTRSSRARRCGPSSPRTSRRSSRSRPTTRRSSRSCSASRRCARRRWADRGRDRGLPPGPRARRRQRAGARRARAARARTPKYELTIADLLEPLYRHLGDYQKLIGVHEVQVRRSDDVEPQRRAPPPDRAALRGRGRGSQRRRSRRSRARSRKTRPNETTQQQLDRVARATGRFEDLAQVFAGPRRASIEDPTLASALYTMSARVYEEDLGNVDTAIALYRKVLEIDPRTSPLRSRSSASSARRSATRSSRSSSSARREILEEPLDKKDALFQAAAIEEDVLERPEAAIAVYSEGARARLRRPPRHRRAHQALPRALALGGPPRGLRARRPISSPTPTRRSASTTRSARSTSASSATSRRRSTRTRRSSSSTPTTCRRSRGSTSSTSRRRTGRSCSRVLTRESEMTGDPNEAHQLPVPDRRALREAPRRRTARRRALSRYPRPVRPDHEPTLAALEGMKAGDKDPLGAAAVLEPVYEATSDWPKLIACTRCRSSTRPTRSRRWTSSTASRASTRTRSTTTPPRSTPTPARSRSTTATRRRSRTSSAWRWS